MGCLLFFVFTPVARKEIPYRPSPAPGQASELRVRIHDPGVSYPFQEGKIGDAVRVEGALAEIRPQFPGEFFRPEYLALAEAEGFDVVTR